MKKILLFIFFILLINIVSAGDIVILQENYYSGETVQAYLYNYTSNPLANIYVLDNQSNQVSVQPSVIEFREDQFLAYFNLPLGLESNVYDLVVLSDRVNFTIENSSNVLTIKPGVFVLENRDSSVQLEVENVGEEELTLEIGTSNPLIVPRKTILDIGVGESKNIFYDFEYSALEGDSEVSVKYNSKTYTIPIIHPDIVEVVNETVEINETVNVTEEVNETEDIVIVGDAIEFISNESEKRVDINRTVMYEATISLINNMDEDLDVLIVMSGDLASVLSIDNEPEKLGANSQTDLRLVFNKNMGALPGEYKGDLRVISDEFEAKMSFVVNVLEPETEEDIEVEDLEQYIVDVGDQEEGTDPVVWIGVVMIAVLLVILLILFIKMKEKPKKDYNEVLQGRRQ
ncbi:hypothetical protein HOD38_06010 [archaeon]|jgi:hypothetical protein|nr:hypothetical protein [archaeon]MBT4397793.1 hypothetical protein [archaeon]MBT4441127.1 hypothetical protein [archaeon]